MIQIIRKPDCFLVSNYFVDTFLCEANGSFVKVYLYILRHCDNQGLKLSDIANSLNLLESDVIRALKYWHKQNVLSFSKQSDEDFSIEFLQFPPTGVQPKAESEPNNLTKTVTQKQTSVPTAVSYTKSDINTYMKNNDGIRHMFLISEQILNRTLTDTDCKILFGLYDYLRLPIEVIFTLLEHCVSNGKDNMRYIEKVAYSWADKEINTLAKASMYVKEHNELVLLFKKYKKMFKITGREFTNSEENYIKSWVLDLKLTDNVIEAAFEKTVANTGKIAFGYMDAILKNSPQGAKVVSKPQNTSKKNFFQDYDEEISDFEVEIIKNRVNKK